MERRSINAFVIDLGICIECVRMYLPIRETTLSFFRIKRMCVCIFLHITITGFPFYVNFNCFYGF